MTEVMPDFSCQVCGGRMQGVDDPCAERLVCENADVPLYIEADYSPCYCDEFPIIEE